MTAERRLRYLVDLIAPVLLPGWTVTLHVHDCLPIQPKDAAAGYGTVGRCDAKWQYTSVDLHIGLDIFTALERQSQAMWVLHELMHGAVNEMRVRGKDHEERVVSGLTAGFMRAIGSPALRKELRG